VRSNNALRRALTTVGTTGDRLALARDVLLGVGRIAPFVLSLRKDWITSEMQARLEAVQRCLVTKRLRKSAVEQGSISARRHSGVH
jgi:magnesium transporter